MSLRQRPSLRRRLLIGLLLLSTGYWLVITLLTLRDSVNTVYELFDAHLAQTALALLRVSDPDDTDPVQVPARPGDAPSLGEIFGHWPEWRGVPVRVARADTVAAGPVVPGSIPLMHQAYEKQLRYQVWSGNGRLLLRSANAPAGPMTGQDGYSEAAEADGQVWRHFAVWDQHREVRILVSEAHALRNQLVRSIALHTVGPLALGLPVLLVLMGWGIQRGLDPLGLLTRQIAQRQPDKLLPLDTGSAPREVQAMVLALNHLLHRVDNALAGERRFTANAAHELRTPLAAIQAHLHVARRADNAGERQRALDQLQRGVERGARVVDQMLALARLDPEQSLPEGPPVALGPLAESACAELAPLALQRQQTLALQVSADAPAVNGQADLLAMLLANLLDNAIRYTPKGSCISVAVRREGKGNAVIEVIDDGPGIPPAERSRVFERFVRLAGTDQPGTGLGLAICRRIAELHQAQITLGEAAGGHGLAARVALPAVQPDAGTEGSAVA